MNWYKEYKKEWTGIIETVALIAGTLNASGEANCNHHDHEHGEGHSCGHGRRHE